MMPTPTQRADSIRERYRTSPDLPIVWSYGGGTQTAAIAVLVLQGRLPRPDHIIMADTGREATATWDYLDTVVQPALEAEGMRVEVAPHSLASKDLWDNDGKPMMPVYTAGGDGESIGRMRNFCSGEWKRDVVERFLRSLGYGPKNPAQQWLGFSTDEIQRLKRDHRPWLLLRYPLCFDVPTSRHECTRLVVAHGWPEPPKSSCWMCPHRSNRQWRDLRDNWPADFAAACALDDEIRLRDADAFVHHSGVPLRLADLGTAEAAGLFSAAESCDSGYCFV